MRFDVRGEKQVVHEARQAVGVALDDADELELVGGELAEVTCGQRLRVPTIEVSGVRSSWDTVARNSSFKRSSSPFACGFPEHKQAPV